MTRRFATTRPVIRLGAFATAATLTLFSSPLPAQDPLGDPVSDREREERCFCVAGQGDFRPSVMVRTGRPGIGVFLGDAVEVDGRWGVRVEDVMEGGPAARAGLQAGDVLVAVAGDPLGSNAAAALQRRISSAEAGDTVELTALRDGQNRQVRVVLEELGGGWGRFSPRLRAMPAPDAPRPPAVFRWRSGGADAPRPGARLRGWGLDREDLHEMLPSRMELHRLAPLALRHRLELVEMNPELGRYFGVDQGVLVAEAAEDNRLGLEAGDVIVAIGDREVRTPEHAYSILRSYLPDEEVELRVMRDRRATTVRGTRGR